MTVPTPPSHVAGAPTGASGRVDPATATAARDARLTWIVGGSLLIAYAALILVVDTGRLYVPGVAWALDVLWAAALMIFALGIRRSGSVVARGPLGLIALVVAALVPFAARIVWAIVPP